MEFIREEFKGLTTQTVLKANVHRIECILTILTTSDPDTLMTTLRLEELKSVAKLPTLVLPSGSVEKAHRVSQ